MSSPSPSERQRTVKAQSLPIIPSVKQSQRQSQRIPQPTPTKSAVDNQHARYSPPSMSNPRPIKRIAPSFLSSFRATGETWQMTDELMAEIERADHAQTLSQQPLVPGTSGVTYYLPRPIDAVKPCARPRLSRPGNSSPYSSQGHTPSDESDGEGDFVCLRRESYQSSTIPTPPTVPKSSVASENTRIALPAKVEYEPRLVDPSVNEYVNSRTGTLVNGILSCSSSDLTGQVTKSSHHPFAKGSYGDIYKGTYRLGDRSINVAIKTSRMYLQYDQELSKKMKRFRREISVWRRLKHPNILPFFGTITDPSTNPDIPAMVCPFAENGALTAYLCERDNEFIMTERLSLINDVAHGLQYLHSQQIVHGDLSGSNMLIDGEERACIADFGLSTLLTRLGGSTFATTRQEKGTMRWMAPEVLDPDNSNDSSTTPTMQSDTYSFGSIVLQILTGNIPYCHLARDEQVLFAIVKGAKHIRPDTDAVTDHWWKFMEWCWSPVRASKSRPSSDEISEFARGELAKLMTIDQKVELATSASYMTTSLLQLPAQAAVGLVRSSTTGVTLHEDDSLIVKAAGEQINRIGNESGLTQEQRVGNASRPPSHTIATLARLPVAEIIEPGVDTPLADLPPLQADPLVARGADEFVLELLDKALAAKKKQRQRYN